MARPQYLTVKSQKSNYQHVSRWWKTKPSACQTEGENEQQWPEHVTKKLQTLVARPQKLTLKSQKVVISRSADDEAS